MTLRYRSDTTVVKMLAQEDLAALVLRATPVRVRTGGVSGCAASPGVRGSLCGDGEGGAVGPALGVRLRVLDGRYFWRGQVRGVQ